MTDLYLALSSLLVISGYLTSYVIVRHEIPTSVSATYYGCKRSWPFSVAIALSALLALLPIMDFTQEDYRPFGFFMAAAMMFVAATPAFRDGLAKRVHIGAAATLLVCGTLWIWFSYGIPWVILGFAVIALINRKRYVWWLEIGLLINVYIALLSLALIQS